MRCACCDKNLNDYESTLRHAITDAYLDTCRKCLKGLGIPVKMNSHEPDAASPDEIEDLMLDEELDEDGDGF